MKKMIMSLFFVTALMATGCDSGNSVEGGGSSTSGGSSSSMGGGSCPESAVESMALYTTAYQNERAHYQGPLTLALLIKISVKMSRHLEVIPEDQEINSCCDDQRFKSTQFCQETAQ